MKIRKKRINVILAVLCVLSVLVGTTAFFTDRIQASVTATAGTLDLNLSNLAASQTTEFKPGQGISITYTLKNAGNKSADILETLVITSAAAMTDSTTIPAEFELYNAADVTLDANGIATLAASAQPIAVAGKRVFSADKKQLTYSLDQFTLNGNASKTGAETETGITTDTKSGSYVLVFSEAAGNAFQNISLSLDYEAQAKQHRNTSDDTWTTVKSETVTFAGNSGHAAVPVAPALP